ncbi:MAG: toll/interleukin-1 receptor domain-containing protein [Pseudomonadota bacterium]
MMRIFISYSHKDKQALDRLHVHLASLRRQNLISQWFDREILAGDDIDEEISIELEQADLFLLLVSPDFIASDYCIERELERAIERHDAGLARVVPVIIEPCDWASMPRLRRLKAVPDAGKPVSEWANQNTAYLNVAQEVRRICEQEKPRSPVHSDNASENQPNVASRYRVKRDFDEIDRSDFRDEAFSITKEYFRRAIEEIDTIDGIRGRFSDGGPTAFGSTIVNGMRTRGTGHITVHRGGSDGSMGDIFWSFKENASRNSANGWVSVSADEYEMFLKGPGSFMHKELDNQNPTQFAEYLWLQVIEQAGIDHA